ncbi:MAG: hypothetical protein LOX97_08290 [Sphingomonas sp.]|nr:hypothetical protein [Sphingomonas sp.]
MAVALGPKVERLAANNEGFVAKFENTREIVDDLWVEYAFVQAKTSWQMISESMISSDDKKPF